MTEWEGWEGWEEWEGCEEWEGWEDILFFLLSVSYVFFVQKTL